MPTYYHKDVDPVAGPVGHPMTRPIVSSIRVQEGPGHDMVHVWNRGGNSGTLVVNRGDGERIAAFLLPPEYRRPE